MGDFGSKHENDQGFQKIRIFGRDRKDSNVSIAMGCALPYATTVIREEAGLEKAFMLEYGYRVVRLPKYPKVPLWLVVVKGFGHEPKLLLTNVPMRKNRKVLWWAVSSYLTSWRIEETIRFGKQPCSKPDFFGEGPHGYSVAKFRTL